jgi:tetratricopeptide (TPR) repeat protein
MMTAPRKRAFTAALTVFLACLVLYLPAFRCGFVNFDDPEYVLLNPVIRELTPGSIAAMFGQAHVGWWMPLTWLSLAVDYHFWGVDPLGYHLSNILLHAVNGGLVVLIAASLCRLAGTDGEESGRRTLVGLVLAGLLFGVHPLRVESVAWVTERKDVLNGFFTFGSVLWYLLYLERREKPAWNWYLLSLIFFAASLMAKSTSVVLPLMLLALDWAPLERLRREGLWRPLREKIPYFAVAVLSSLWTITVAARSSYLVTYEAFPFAQRLVVSGNAVWEYVRLLMVPVGLGPFNVIPDPIPAGYMVATVLVGIVLGAIFLSPLSNQIKSAVICFLLPMLPVLAFFQNGDQSFADRFTYLPALSPSIFLALVFVGAEKEGRVARLAPVVTGFFLILCMGLTVRQIGVWRSAESFWTRVVQVEPLAITHKERGRYYLGAGRYNEAVADFTAALGMMTPTLQPYAYNFYAFRGEALRGAGRFEEAVADFTTAIGFYPHPAYLFRRGLALKALGRIAEAEGDFRRAGPDPGPIAWFDKEN